MIVREMDKDIAEKWVAEMENTDPSHASGGRWTMEELKPLAKKYSIGTDGSRFYEFFVMTNAM